MRVALFQYFEQHFGNLFIWNNANKLTFSSCDYSLGSHVLLRHFLTFHYCLLKMTSSQFYLLEKNRVPLQDVPPRKYQGRLSKLFLALSFSLIPYAFLGFRFYIFPKMMKTLWQIVFFSKIVGHHRVILVRKHVERIVALPSLSPYHFLARQSWRASPLSAINCKYSERPLQRILENGFQFCMLFKRTVALLGISNCSRIGGSWCRDAAWIHENYDFHVSSPS